MSIYTYPRPASDLAIELAQEILKGRFVSDHKDYNEMLRILRDRKLDVQMAFFGECSRDAIPVVEAVADANLKKASIKVIERKITALRRTIEASVASSHARVDIARLGGPGAAGRQRDQARASERRNITTMLINRLTAEVRRRSAE